MAQTVVINNVVYQNFPSVQIPLEGGGTATFYDTSEDDGSAANVENGIKVHGASGEIIGSMPNNGDVSGTIGTKNGTVVIPAGKTTGGTVSLTNVSDCVAGNILSGKSILGVSGSLTMPTISQNAQGVLSIS